MRFSFSLLYLILFLFLLSSCDDMKDVPTPVDLPETPGESGKIFVLSEGLFNMNNSTLSLINFENRTIKPDFFSSVNDRKLGDTANDMKIYGNWLWIVVNVSSQIEVIDINSGISVRRIPIFNDRGVARQPRFITFSGIKAYVCSFDGTVTRIDISTLTVDGNVSCGRNPDGITVANGKVYVSNSGGLDQPDYDNTVSVIDLNTFTEIKKITVGVNPYKMETDNEGDVYVVSRGNNSDIKANWSRINSQTDEVVQTFDCKTEQLISENFISDSTKLERPFGIYVHPTNGNVYLTDAHTYTIKGDLLCFNRNGKLQYKLESIGLNPNAIIAVP